MNRVLLVGNCGKDAEKRTLSSGKTVMSFTLATRDGKDVTNWHNITVWNPPDFLDVSKGARVAVDGSIRNSTYDDKDGTKRHRSEVVAYRVESFGNGGEKTKDAGPRPVKPEQHKNDRGTTDDDLPF